MLLGIMSDSHGDAAATAAAVSLLEARGAAYLIHCGDICGEQVLDELAGRPCTFVWGNCDFVTPALRNYVQALGLTVPNAGARLVLGDRHIAVFHGHEPEFDDAGRRGKCDYIFHGHTHRFADRTIGTCRIINPGALFRARPRTCALVDLRNGALQIMRIDNGVSVALTG